MIVNTSAIARFMHENKCKAVLVVDESQYDSLMTAFMDEGNRFATGPKFSIMANNRSIIENGGEVAITFYSEKGQPRWYGFCWPDYYRQERRYKFMDPSEVFVEEESDDFEFDQSMALTYLFGLGGT